MSNDREGQRRLFTSLLRGKNKHKKSLVLNLTNTANCVIAAKCLILFKFGVELWEGFFCISGQLLLNIEFKYSIEDWAFKWLSFENNLYGWVMFSVYRWVSLKGWQRKK